MRTSKRTNISEQRHAQGDVAKTWLTGFNQMDFDEAMNLSTNDTKNLLSSLQQLTEKVSDSGKKELKKIKVTIKDVKVNGDKAVATYTTTDNPKDQELKLVKQNDKWLVEFSKTDLMGDMSQKADDKTCRKCGKAMSAKHNRCIYCGEERPPELL